MTLRDFNNGVCRYQRFGLILLGVTGLALVVYGAAAISFTGALRALGERLFGTAQAGVIGPLALVPVVVLTLGGSALIQQLVSKDRRVVCSYCGRLLVGGTVRLVTVATRHCPLCGQQVIEEPNAEPA